MAMSVVVVVVVRTMLFRLNVEMHVCMRTLSLRSSIIVGGVSECCCCCSELWHQPGCVWAPLLSSGGWMDGWVYACSTRFFVLAPPCAQQIMVKKEVGDNKYGGFRILCVFGPPLPLLLMSCSVCLFLLLSSGVFFYAEGSIAAEPHCRKHIGESKHKTTILIITRIPFFVSVFFLLLLGDSGVLLSNQRWMKLLLHIDWLSIGKDNNTANKYTCFMSGKRCEGGSS